MCERCRFTVFSLIEKPRAISRLVSPLSTDRRISSSRRVSPNAFVWRRVVSSYTRGSYQERIVNDEVHQVFDSGRSRLA